jgi:hypothetical protein
MLSGISKHESGITTEVRNGHVLRRVGPTHCCSINLISGIAHIPSRRAVKKTTQAD